MIREPANQTQKSPNQSKDWTSVSHKLPPRFELVRIKDEFGREQFGWCGMDRDWETSLRIRFLQRAAL